MKSFEIPTYYQSNLIGKVKLNRKKQDPRKQDFSPTIIDFGSFEVLLARHFGFCYGVENAIEKAYLALAENPDKRIFLLSQMIHNPEVNDDLIANGISFIQDTEGNALVDWNTLTSDDVVIIPAFGTTIQTQEKLERMGIETQKYNTTCPFVEKVWNRSHKLGKDDFTVIIHGKPIHEETRATFSHSASQAQSLVIKNMKEAQILAKFILEELKWSEFDAYFEGRYSEDFSPERHLDKIGVVNQTTMLASDTQAIADYLKEVMTQKFGIDNSKNHFANTRDTLCYATNDNQQATFGLLKESADVALVVGGYNSSNTSHLVELCEEKLPTFFVKNETELKSKDLIHHFDWRNKKLLQTENWFPKSAKPRVIITSGASCPDSVLERVLVQIHSFFSEAKSLESVQKEID